MTTDVEPMLTLKDLIERGAISVPTTLRGAQGGHRFEVTLEKDGSIVHGDQRFTSLSVAAGRLITLASRQRTPGRGYFAVNGWRFWTVSAPDGSVRTLMEIRNLARQ